MAMEPVNSRIGKNGAKALLESLVLLVEGLAPAQQPQAIIDLTDGKSPQKAALERTLRLLALSHHVVKADDYRERLTALEQASMGRSLCVLVVHAGADSAPALVASLAGEGLFDSEPSGRFPLSSTTAATLHILHKRDYRIRQAVVQDLPRLYQLEELCWQHTRTSKPRLRARVQGYPQGQYVLEKDGKVLGVVYSQRIAGADALDGMRATNVHQVHDESGSVIQLLALNVDPAAQNLNLGDQLLEFTLQLCSVLPGIDKVVGVTICKSFDARISGAFDEYIWRSGNEQDPVLAFHQAHGASIIKAMPQYRPQDTVNQCNGVLVAYDILHRVAKRHDIVGETPAPEAVDIGKFVQEMALRMLGERGDEFDLERPVMEMGLDSAHLLKMQLQLEQLTGSRLPGAFFFQYNTLAKVIGYFSARVAPKAATAVHAAAPAAGDIAVIGMSCRLPGGIDTPDALWQVLASGQSKIGPYPASRGSWPSSADYPGIDRGGFLHGAETFDASFFRMSPAEAQITDPQQRILLGLAWACLEDAGVLPAALKGSQAGVFIGASNGDYSRLVQEARIETQAHHATGSSLAILANRLSYFFDLSGPSMLIDTACSSSLVALHAAIQSIRTGECPVALVGGVNFICHPDLSIAYHRAGMLSPDALCKVFDAGANGYVRAEGAVVMLLKPLHQAIADQDRIHAVIKGSAVNHGGLAGGLTVPNPQKQSELMLAAWKNAGIASQELGYIEAHGTGTSLGDPIEVQGIAQAYQGDGCAIGSIKSNLGHLESAAGLAGLLKVILSMKHGQLPASINFGRLNPKIDLGASGLHVVSEAAPWPAGRPRVAGVSSFGSGGANAHVVVQEYNGDVDRHERPAATGHLFILSAATAERLHEYVGQVIDFLDEPSSHASFADMIYSWQLGRTALRQRLAVKADDRADLRSKLQRWMSEAANGIDTWYGVASPHGQGQAIAGKDLDRLGPMWVAGASVDWRSLHHADGLPSPRRVALPTYPFGGERYWVDGAATMAREHGTVIATPAWREAAIDSVRGTAVAKHVVFMCELAQVDAEQLASAVALDRCQHLQALAPDENIAERYTRYALACFEELQAVLAAKPQGRVLFQVVAADELFAGLSGMLMTASQENPQLVGQVILSSANVRTGELADQLLHEKAHLRDPLVRYADGKRYARAWEPVACTPGGVPFKEDGVYLITGGLGGLGRLFARDILQQGSRVRIILTGRETLSPHKQAQLDELALLARDPAATIEYRQLDVQRLEQVGELIASILAQYRQLNGIIHSAGMIADSYILKKPRAAVEQVLAPKVAGLSNLDQASQGIALDFMVMFSSIFSVMGNPGQADYAAANGFMDQFAAYRNKLVAAGQRQGRTLAINWPLWKDGGMAMDTASLQLMTDATGMVPLQTATGMDLFHLGVTSSLSQLVVMEGETGKIEATLARAGSLVLPRHEQDVAAVDAALLAQETVAKLKQLFGDVIKLAAGKIDANEPLSTYGIDSILINKLNVKLAGVFGGISKTLFFEYATLTELTGYLVTAYEAQCVAWTGLTAFAPRAVAAPSTPVVHLPALAGRQQEIAIIGISGMYPEAPTLERFWENLRTGKNSVGEIPAARWALDGFYHPDPEQAVEQGMSYSKWGGFVEQFAEFDPLFFSMSPREALNIDPQERLFLQESWRAMENAGYTRSDLKQKFKQRVGVFAGITKAGFNLYAANAAGRDDQFFPFTSFSSAANRVSYFLDVTGPSMPIDTMCSSSLTAIHEACEHIARGECELAFAGGVNLYLHPSSYTWLSSQQMLSRDGLCKSFGAGGNGYVPGEGVGVVLLKPLARAIEDGDHIHGVIVATHVNHGGKANAYTVPSPRAQAALIRHTLDKAGLKSTDVSYIEAHGTGTELGDPIEISGLQQAFAKDSDAIGYCSIGSAKSNIGHLEAAAGMAGLTKVLLQMRHRQLVPSLHAAKLNPNIDFDQTAFRVNQALVPWEAARRIAGISSFGAGGANAHILVREYLPVENVSASAFHGEPLIVVLSARTVPQLQQRARDLLAYVNAADQPVDLQALAYTLQVGREAMEERAGFLVKSTDELTVALAAFVAGDTEAPFRGQVAGNKATLRLLEDEEFSETLEKWIVRRKFPKLLDLWTKGLEFDWNKLYTHGKPRRLALPGYPFARQVYWIDAASMARTPTSGAALHPLLHRNTSDLSGQSYASVFSGAEFFLADHKVNGEKVFPAVAYLEMARAAIELAAPPALKAGMLELRNTAWAKPLTVAAATTVTIGLSMDAAEPGQIDFAISSAAGTHCQGQAVYRAQTAPAMLDIARLRAGMQLGDLDVKTVYAAFADMGIAYGTSHRAISVIQRGQRELLAQLDLPSSATGGNYFMHPSLMDSALQATIGLLGDLGQGRAMLPFSLDTLRIYSACTPAMFAWVRFAASAALGGGVVKFDVDLCDEDGRICVQMHGFSSREMEGAPQVLHGLAPVWNHIPSAQLNLRPPAPSDKVLLLGGSQAQLDWVRQAYPGAAGIIQAQVQEQEFDHLVWIAPDVATGTSGDMIGQQSGGVLAVFRIAKALLSAGYADKKLQWTLICCNTQSVKRSDRIAPVHAAVFGFIGSLAKEHPEWCIRLLDIDSLASLDAGTCLSLPVNDNGDGLAHRAGEWFSAGLARVSPLPQALPAYRQGGVYVVIGGAGGIGETWSRFMAQNYGARLVWIGRQAAGPAIEEKCRAIGQLGHAPVYFSADATDLASLQQAFDGILALYPQIHGVVHSAIVLHDQRVALMEESTFMNSLAAKVDVSVNMDRVFGQCDLDFMLFFSSLISFTKAPGQSNYSAGCTFKDSFALHLAQQRPYPVKIMNWGYWGGVGVVTSDFYNKRMQQLGVGSIEPNEAMTSLQALVGSGLNQMALMKTIKSEAVDAISLPQGVTLYPVTSAFSLPAASVPVPLDRLRDNLLPENMLALTARILASTLASLDLLSAGAQTANPIHQRWLTHCLGYLDRQAPPSLASLWDEWDTERTAWDGNPNIRAQTVLLEACLRALPDILTGKRLATDVMFPDSSMRLVEGVYKNNELSDFFNGALGEMLVACIRRKLAEGGTIRILEIGAGTGGTTARLLPLLQPFGTAIAEYCYTDLSKAFLIHAEEQYQPQLPALRTAIFDASQPLAGQGMPGNHFDFVIATNVLHATPDIRETLRNAKATLKHQGVLLLNEMSVWSLFNHLTFGLLDGWWLYEDEALRLPGSPGLAPEQWREVLFEEGFGADSFVVPDAHELGQQVIAAVSDGVVRQRIPATVMARTAEVVAAPAAPADLATPDAVLRHKAASYLQALVAKTLRIAPSEIAPGRLLSEYGLDSILVVGLTSQLRKVFTGITSTLLFEVQHINGLVDYFLAKNRPQLLALPGGEAPAAAIAIPPAPARSVQLSAPPVPSIKSGIVDVAIIGLSGRYPRSANLDEFWKNLSNGSNCVTEIPKERWEWADYFDPEKGKAGKIYSKWGGFLDDIDKFDPLFFKVSPKEAKAIDPQERLFLETCYHAIEDAGYTPANLADIDKIGVFAGVMNARYTVQPLHYSIANRVSWLLNFQGPSMAVDTACSASLTAIHLALESIYSGSSECAIAGGVNLIIDPVHYLELSALTMLSSGNQCKSFGADADGFVDADGVGAVVLKPLALAERDGDHIYGVIKGSAVNAGGRTNGYTVPNPIAQSAVVTKALARAGLEAWQIGYIEAHGTGTALGDPIEIAGLTHAFSQTTRDKQFCAIGSLKSNIGHCESAAGIAGLTKVLLQLKHQQLAPSLHARVPNPEIDFGQTPFKVQLALEPWERPQREMNGVPTQLPRIAGVSSFGAGGANAHVIVQEYVTPVTVASVGPVAVPLSARTMDQLTQKAGELAACISAARLAGTPLALASLAYTLQVGRESLEQRAGFVVQSLDELEQKLVAFSDGKLDIGGMWQGKVKRHQEATVDAGSIDLDLATVLQRWVQGVTPDWNLLYGPQKPRRISLPVYPFARERYWHEVASVAPSSRVLKLHPLLHENVSDIRQQRYATTFDGDDTLLRGHDNGAGCQMLPAVTLLEMARAAVEDSLFRADDCTPTPHSITLQRVAFGDPVMVVPGKKVHVALFACNDSELDFEIYGERDGDADEIIHCQGHASIGLPLPAVTIDLGRIREQLRQGERTGNSHYDLLASRNGLRCGEAYRGMTSLRIGAAQCLAEITVPAGMPDTHALLLHPVMLDCALQAAFDLIAPAAQVSLPVALDSVDLLMKCTTDMVAWVRYTDGALDVDLCDRQGRVCVRMRGVAHAQEAGKGMARIALEMDVATAVTPAAAAPPRPRKVSLSATS